MSSDYTEQQSSEEARRASELSLRQTRPPTNVPGYELTQFLGAGAYGEVWIGLDRTTGRQVAVKFYRHRQGVDWSLLSREVEKLVFLSADRYVVQLLDVGWEADPPYYVMEYVENGSLEELLNREGPRPASEAVEIFRETAIGLNHAHAKGVLHCDLKPANILLDQDARPRLADFGQARLSHEQKPSLGTLFYMAPEQADLDAVPDARWDVYALGAIFHCMLVGTPPFHSEQILAIIEGAKSLPERLECYRQWIKGQEPPSQHRQVAHVDNALATIIDRCLATRPSRRFANVQEVLNALQARDEVRLRRPLLLLGILGPLLLMIVMAVFGWRGYARALGDSDQAVTAKVRESNSFAAKFVATSVSTEIQRYFRAVERAAQDTELRTLVADVGSQLEPLLTSLADPVMSAEEHAKLRARFVSEEAREPLQRKVKMWLDDKHFPKVASWFVCDRRGTQIAAAFDRKTAPTIGNNFAYRTYCHGGPKDLDKQARPLPATHVDRTHLSAPLLSTATGTLKLAISTPIFDSGEDRRFLGVLALTVEVGNFLKFPVSESRFAVLVDGRDDGFQGVILHHPLFTEVFDELGRLPDTFTRYRVKLDENVEQETAYQDPLGKDEKGRKFDRPWIAAREPVVIEDDGDQANGGRIKTGLFVLVQEDKQAAMHPILALGDRLAREGLFALGGILLVVFLLWYFVLRVLGEPRVARHAPLGGGSSMESPTPRHARPTLPIRPEDEA